jgi:cysteinyl-tRNA synthetase|tara:strand:- start:402 stop:1154 length:753 start_codon:yes stop_codon:yes gene_type:complete
MTVYECIAAVSDEIARTGIAKTHSNSAQGYQFRGIDDVYNALAPLIAKHKLVIMPRMMSRTQTEKATRSGGSLFCVVVEAEFDFVSATDSTQHTVRMFGEAMDSADKATNKAMSAAFKYAAFQTFCIPTEGDDNDADSSSPEPMVKKAVAPVKSASVPVEKVAVTKKTYPSSDGDVRPISEPQQRRMFAIAKKRGVEESQIKGHLALMGIESTSDIQRQDYGSIVAWIESGGPVAAVKSEVEITADDVPF